MFKNLISKFIKVPETNEVKMVEAVQLWEVRWWSRQGGCEPEHIRSAQQEIECFTSEEVAEAFAKSLENAFHLLKYTGGGRRITVTKAGGSI